MEFIPPFTQILLQIGNYFIAREIDKCNGHCFCWLICKQGNIKNGFEVKEIYRFWVKE